MLAQVIYDEYREWFSAISEDGNLSVPKWDELDADARANWWRVANVAETHVKEEIARNW
jgi:hypothetical protein